MSSFPCRNLSRKITEGPLAETVIFLDKSRKTNIEMGVQALRPAPLPIGEIEVWSEAPRGEISFGPGSITIHLLKFGRAKPCAF